MPEAHHYSILIADVEASGALLDAEKVEVRHDLYALMRDVLDRNGVAWDQCVAEDRGDGVYLLVPAAVPKRRLGAGLVATLHDLLGERRLRDISLRLRLSLHCGEVTRDDEGSSGTDVDHAFAMVDNQGVRDLLRAAPGARLVVVVSESMFGVGFNSQPSDDPTWMRRQYLQTKRGEMRVWVGVPGLSQPPAVDPPCQEATVGRTAAPPTSPIPQTYVAPVMGGDNLGAIAGQGITVGRDYAPRTGAR